jgi:hypothetical protein
MKFDPFILSGSVNEGNLAFEVSKDERLSSRNMLKIVREKPRAILFKAFLNGHMAPEYEEEIIKARALLVKRGIETTANKEFVAKLEKGKNPFR